MKYLFLGLAICLEVVGSGFLAKSNGFTRLMPSIITVIAFSAPLGVVFNYVLTASGL